MQEGWIDWSETIELHAWNGQEKGGRGKERDGGACIALHCWKENLVKKEGAGERGIMESGVGKKGVTVRVCS